MQQSKMTHTVLETLHLGYDMLVLNARTAEAVLEGKTGIYTVTLLCSKDSLGEGIGIYLLTRLISPQHVCCTQDDKQLSS